MAGINVTIAANAEAAKRALQGFGKQAEGAKRLLDRLFPKGGGNSGAAQMGKQLQQLTKQTEAYTQKLQILQGALKQVHQQQSVGGATGPVAKGLEKQQKLLESQIRTTQARIGNLSSMSQAVQNGAVPPPPRGRGRNEEEGGGAGVAEYAMAFGKGMLGPLAILATGAGLASMVKLAVTAAAEDQKAWADLLPRVMTPGALSKIAGTPAESGLTAKLRRDGRLFGYGSRDVHSLYGSLSQGGTTNLNSLQGDARSVMQYSRMFGLDVGAQGGMFAEAQKMGAFKAGDAKRFAQILAQEIAHSGLGPRAEEVQQATLMLLNTAMRTQASAGPGGLMGLQTLFNRTGVPGLQGTRGAGIIASMQEQFTNPGSDANSALDQLVMRSMGIQGYYKQERFREKAFQDPRLFSQYIKVLRQNSRRSPQEDELETRLKARFPELTYSRLEALRKHTSNFRDITPGAVQAAIAPGGALAKGAAAAMQMGGNKLRVGEATLDDLAIRVGTPIVNKIGDLAVVASKEFDKLAGIFDNSKGTVDLLQGLSDHFLGTKTTAAIQKGMTGLMGGNPSVRGGLKTMAKFGIPGAAEAGAFMDLARHYTTGDPVEHGKLWNTKRFMPPARFMPFIAEAAARTGLDPSLIAAVMHHESRFNPGARSKAGAMGLMQLMPGTAAGLGVDAKDPRQNIIGGSMYLARQIKRFGSISLGLAAYNAGPGRVREYGGVPPFAETQAYGPSIMRVYHIIQEAGVVSEQSKHAVKKLVKDTAGEMNQTHARTHPNRVNRR